MAQGLPMTNKELLSNMTLVTFLFGKNSLILEKAMKITLFIYKRKTWKVRTKNAEFIVSRKRDRTEAYEE